jgi:hypothetical protein
LASVVLPEPGNPHTMNNLDPVAVLSISGLSLRNGLLVAGVFTPKRATSGVHNGTDTKLGGV